MSGVRVGLVPVDRIRFHPHNVRRDLGDLRSLTRSIERFGVMQPVVLEEYGDQLRLRAGHRRVAAARLARVTKVPALIHAQTLDDDEWLLASVHENAQRRALDEAERRRTIAALRRYHCTWDGIAEAFGVSVNTVQGWARGQSGDSPADGVPAARREPRPSHVVARRKVRDLCDEFEARPDATVPALVAALRELVTA